MVKMEIINDRINTKAKQAQIIVAHTSDRSIQDEQVPTRVKPEPPSDDNSSKDTKDQQWGLLAKAFFT